MSIHDDINEADEITTAPLEFDDNVLDEWIGGGDVTKHLVVMYGKPQLAAEYEALEDQIRLVSDTASDDGELGGSEVGKLRRRLEEVYAEWKAARSRWTVRAITDEALDEAEKATAKIKGPQPVPPKEPSKDAPASKREDYDAKFKKYERANRDWNDHSNAELIMRLVEHIEFADGRVARVTKPEQIITMRATFGEQQIIKILDAARLGRMLSPELRAPFSSSTSRGDQT